MDQATEIAKLLLNIKAVTMNFHEPYRYTSGILSPIYCDNRLIISYPQHREVILHAFMHRMRVLSLRVDIIAGTATAGIAHAAWIADHLNLPMVYVRTKAKEHGKHNQIEGRLEKGHTAVVIEDLISTGGSAIAAATALRESGAIVNDCLTIFNYELPQAQQSFSDAKLNLHCLSNLSALLDTAVRDGTISEEEKKEALKWQRDPEHWTA